MACDARSGAQLSGEFAPTLGEPRFQKRRRVRVPRDQCNLNTAHCLLTRRAEEEAAESLFGLLKNCLRRSNSP